MTAAQHLYVIPTNREAGASIASLLDEIKIAFAQGKLSPDQLVLVVLDSGNEHDFAVNHDQLLHSLAGSAIKAYHVTADDFDQLLRQAVDPDVVDLVVGEEFSYGKMVNKISIMANLLGTRYVHRRDSDVYLQADRSVTPLLAELEGFAIDDKVKLVGSSYIGAWGIDYSDVEDDQETLRKLFSLSKPNYTTAQLDDYINNKYVEGSKETFTGKLTFSEKKANYIDAGNFALKDIFLNVPVSPANVTSGTDYLYHNALGKSDWKMLYHNDRVIHRYNKDRYDRINHILYGDSKLLSRLMTTVTKRALQDQTLSDDFAVMSQQLADAYVAALKSDNLNDDLKDTFAKFVVVYAAIPHENYQAVAQHVAQHEDEYLAKTVRDVQNFVTLLRKWPDVMAETKKISLQEFEING
ncbi:DUF6271 family protein [Fructilactobacillus carniphilus]|uniref:DUF6271 family protein n=1 Tax=Fructilactobacillus carniphilus TaxID=2940297 RepID=A0ABY5BXC2_9LACO|nr:DUF6271 family protein [Fructilactobacillus carniphilus]USS90480.1 DUF6271 family protein [Fructilactobacillus carniphilus]